MLTSRAPGIRLAACWDAPEQDRPGEDLQRPHGAIPDDEPGRPRRSHGGLASGHVAADRGQVLDPVRVPQGELEGRGGLRRDRGHVQPVNPEPVEQRGER